MNRLLRRKYQISNDVKSWIEQQKKYSTNLKVEELIVDFNKLSDFKNKIIGDDVYCTIGTTIKKAGSQDAFTKVDLEYPLSIAKIAKENGAKHFLLMSSLGANAASGNFYLKTKGALENNLRDLNFDSLS